MSTDKPFHEIPSLPEEVVMALNEPIGEVLQAAERLRTTIEEVFSA